MTSLLVVRGGTVAEWYGGDGPDTLHNVMSVTKSVLSLLVELPSRRAIYGLDDTLAISRRRSLEQRRA